MLNHFIYRNIAINKFLIKITILGTTKSTVFSKEQNQLALFAKAFAHPARIAIIQELIKRNTCICGDLVDVLPLSQSTISQHLKALKKIGLIKGIVVPPRVCYCINDAVWQEMQVTLAQFLKAYRPKCCG